MKPKQNDEEPEPVNQVELVTEIKNCSICNHPVSDFSAVKFGDKFICKGCFHEPLRTEKIKELLNENKKV